MTINPNDFQQFRRTYARAEESGRPPAAIYTKVGMVVGGAIGWALGVYSGLNLLILVAASGLTLFVAVKLLPADKRKVAPVVALQGGQVICFVIGMLLQRTVNAALIDVAWCVIGLAWLLAKPARGPVLMLGIYQVFSLASNLYLFAHASFGTVAHRALLMHIVWRILAIAVLGQLYRQLAKRGAGEEPVRAASETDQGTT